MTERIFNSMQVEPDVYAREICMELPEVYVAIDPALAKEFGLDEHLRMLEGLAGVRAWPGPGAPTIEAVSEAIEHPATRVLLTGWPTPPLKELLRDWTPATSSLRLVAHSGGTVRYLVPKDAVERGLRVTHSVRHAADTVAEFTLAAMLVGRRRIIPSALRMKNGEERVPLAEMRGFLDCTVGVVGASTVGRRVLELLRDLHVRALIYDPHCAPQLAETLAGELTDLQDLLRRSDVVTLHAPLLPETTGMIGKAQLAEMKDGALLVNDARGGLVDADALFKELASGRLTAVLDVTDPEEPLPPSSPFFQLENCVITPHIAGNTIETWSNIGKETVTEIALFMSGESMRNEISLARWDTIA